MHLGPELQVPKEQMACRAGELILPGLETFRGVLASWIFLLSVGSLGQAVLKRSIFDPQPKGAFEGWAQALCAGAHLENLDLSWFS